MMAANIRGGEFLLRRNFSGQSLECQIYLTEISKIWGFRKIEKKPHWVLFVAN
jgi:hypothetical protein